MRKAKPRNPHLGCCFVHGNGLAEARLSPAVLPLLMRGEVEDMSFGMISLAACLSHSLIFATEWKAGTRRPSVLTAGVRWAEMRIHSGHSKGLIGGWGNCGEMATPNMHDVCMTIRINEDIKLIGVKCRTYLHVF